MTGANHFKQLDEYVSRKILVSGEALMLVEVSFKKGGVGTPHRHADHEQIGYIAQGSFELTIGDEKRTIAKGDSYHAPRNVLHGVVALEEDSVILDIFTPVRADFLE